MFAQILGVVWPAGSVLAWLTGSAILQSRARNRPIDIRLNIAIFLLTVSTFHLIAYTHLAMTKQALSMQIIPAFDILLILITFIMVQLRVRSIILSLEMFALVCVSSISFWIWYISAIGGLLPK